MERSSNQKESKASKIEKIVLKNEGDGASFFEKIREVTKKINTKKYGRKILEYEVLEVVLDRLTKKDIRDLRERSYDEGDILKVRYDEFLEKNEDKSVSYEKFLLMNFRVKGQKYSI